MTVRQIRTVIFDAGTPTSTSRAGVRREVARLAREAGRALGFEPGVLFTGAVDSAIPASLTADLLATVQEALSNVVRHAGAGKVDVELSVDGELVLSIRDDGVGIPSGIGAGGGRGIANMRSRAEHLGGSLSVEPQVDGGTVLDWRVPLPAPDRTAALGTE